MKTKNLTKFTIAATILTTFVIGLPASAQSVPFTYNGTSPVTLQMDSSGILSALGTYGTGTLGITGAGTRMMWYPGKGAFRAGTVAGTEWDNANIGGNSTAFGSATKASGQYATAIGYGSNSTSIGSVAIGYASNSTGFGSVAIGVSNTASGPNSFAFGNSSVALGPYSIAGGNGASASGQNSLSLGSGTTAALFNIFVIGRYNLSTITSGMNGASYTSWVPADSLFEVGNGSSNTQRSNALTVFKNGNATFQGVVRVAPGGDIPMFNATP